MSSQSSPARKGRILVTHWIHDDVKQYLKQNDLEVESPDEPGKIWSLDEARGLPGPFQALLTCMADHVSASYLRNFPDLKIVSATLKGYDNYDVEECTRRGIWLTVVPDIIIPPTAELAVGLTLSLLRNIRMGDEHVRSGAFDRWRPMLYGSSLQHHDVGIVGAGQLGLEVGRLVSPFLTKTLLYFDKNAPQWEVLQARSAKHVSLTDMFQKCCIIIICLPLTEDTYHLIDRNLMRLLANGSYIINVGRGSTIDEAATLEALQEGRLAGYAADVFEMEDWALSGHPQTIDPALRQHPNTLFTPHLGSAVDLIRKQMSLRAAGQIVEVMEGMQPSGAVNQLP